MLPISSTHACQTSPNPPDNLSADGHASKKVKRPNKLFRACVQCVAAKTRCEDVVPQGCSVCRRKGKECSLAGAITMDSRAETRDPGLGDDAVDVRMSNGTGSREWGNDLLSTQRNEGYSLDVPRASSTGVTYPSLHPLRPHSTGPTPHPNGYAPLNVAAPLHVRDDSVWQERIAESEARIRQLEDRVSTLQSLALTQPSSSVSAYPESVHHAGLLASHRSQPSQQGSSAFVSPYDSPVTTSHAPPFATSQVQISATTRPAAPTDRLDADTHETTLQPTLLANKYSRYTHSFNGGWIVSAYNPASSLCLITRGLISPAEADMAYSAFQQTISARLPLQIWSSPFSDGLGSVGAKPAEHPYMVIAMLHHVSPFNKRDMSGYSLAQAADEVVLASLKPIGQSRPTGDGAVQLVAALLVLALAPTLPDTVGHPTSDVRANEATREMIKRDPGEGVLSRPSSAKYAAMAAQLGRDSGLQAEVEGIVRTAKDQLGEPLWREAYVKVELWMAVIGVYNLMQSHRTPLLDTLIHRLPPSIRVVNPELYDLVSARAEMVQLANACSALMDRLEDEQPAEEDARALATEWMGLFGKLRESGTGLGAALILDRDCLAQALVVRLAMLIQHLPSPLAPLRSLLMPLMANVRLCAETMFRHVVPDDHLHVIKQAQFVGKPPAANVQCVESTSAAASKAKLSKDTLAHASPLNKVPAYVAQCTLMGYMTMQGTVVYMRNMAMLARQRHAEAQARAQQQRHPPLSHPHVLDESGSLREAESDKDGKDGKEGAYGPSSNGAATVAEIESELANITDMTRFEVVAERLRAASGVYGVILDSLEVMHATPQAAAHGEKDKEGGIKAKEGEGSAAESGVEGSRSAPAASDQEGRVGGYDFTPSTSAYQNNYTYSSNPFIPQHIQQPLLDPTMGGLFNTDLFGWDIWNMGAGTGGDGEWNVPYFGQAEMSGTGSMQGEQGGQAGMGASAGAGLGGGYGHGQGGFGL